MKKTLFRVSALLVFVVLLLTASSCRLKRLSIDEAKSNLESAGYTVTVRDGSEYANSEDNNFVLMASELDQYLYAKKGDDEIHLFYFFSIEQAESNYDFISIRELTTGQNNELIYCGTKQAIKDAKL